MGYENCGRRPQSTALKVLRGNPSKRRLNTSEPTLPPAPASADTPPRMIAGDAVAAAEYARLLPILRRARLISEAEIPQVVALVRQWSKYVAAEADVQKRGPVLKDKAGALRRNPYTLIADRALANCLALWRELGLSPSSRSRIAALPARGSPSKWPEML